MLDYGVLHPVFGSLTAVTVLFVGLGHAQPKALVLAAGLWGIYWVGLKEGALRREARLRN